MGTITCHIIYYKWYNLNNPKVSSTIKVNTKTEYNNVFFKDLKQESFPPVLSQ